MDRFIEGAFTACNSDSTNLKSNMDRFIGKKMTIS